MEPPKGLVYRDTADLRSRRGVAADLARQLRVAEEPGRRDEGITAALLLAGALEAALADAGAADDEVRAVAAVADRLAEAYLAGGPAPSGLQATIAAWPAQGELRLSRPEGFAYYALQPRHLAAAARGLGALGAEISVVGIRTIGGTLSAVVRAALAAPAGPHVDRWTVRPSGHPFDRRTLLSAAERRHVEARSAAGATFVVVDEGPGMSGSSFLSVGEALVGAGVPAARVVFLGSRTVDPAALVTPDGAARWRRFRSAAPTPPAPTPPDADADLSGGRWRARFWGDPRDWPAASFPTEREKRLSRDGGRLFKFEGLGPFGGACAARARALASEGLTAAPLAPPDGLGFVAYPWLPGRPLTTADLDAFLLRSIGQYCARRAALFPADPAADAESRLLEMARYDVEVTVGAALPAGFRLPCVRPTIADGRMLPHEWFHPAGGAIYKLDATSHGDDHFYPGPTDVAWDLAGAIVEWGLDRAARAALVEAYEAASGDAVEARLAPYEIAYAAFRACFVRMAAHGIDEQERARLERQHATYRAALERLVRGGAGAAA